MNNMSNSLKYFKNNILWIVNSKNVGQIKIFKEIINI